MSRRRRWCRWSAGRERLTETVGSRRQVLGRVLAAAYKELLLLVLEQWIVWAGIRAILILYGRYTWLRQRSPICPPSLQTSSLAVACFCWRWRRFHQITRLSFRACRRVNYLSMMKICGHICPERIFTASSWSSFKQKFALQLSLGVELCV